MKMCIYIYDFLHYACDSISLHEYMVRICLYIFSCDRMFQCLYTHILYVYVYIYMYMYTPIHECIFMCYYVYI